MTNYKDINLRLFIQLKESKLMKKLVCCLHMLKFYWIGQTTNNKIIFNML